MVYAHPMLAKTTAGTSKWSFWERLAWLFEGRHLLRPKVRSSLGSLLPWVHGTDLQNKRNQLWPQGVLNDNQNGGLAWPSLSLCLGKGSVGPGQL